MYVPVAKMGWKGHRGHRTCHDDQVPKWFVRPKSCLRNFP